MLATIRRLHQEFVRAYCDVTTISAISAQRHIDMLRQACIGERRLEGSGCKIYSQSEKKRHRRNPGESAPSIGALSSSVRRRSKK